MDSFPNRNLKDVIKGKKPDTIKCEADKLQLFLAKTEKGAGAWLTEADVKKGVSDTSDLKLLGAAGAPLNLVGLSEKDVKFVPTLEDVESMNTPVHVLVVVPEGRKRHPPNRWFAESFRPLKKRRVGEDVNEEKRFFDMRDFPSLLEHPKAEFKTIVEREAYVVIFAQLVQYAKTCFEFVPTSASETDEKRKPGKDSNLVVTGNPGIGKSRFFLYCIFQLILREREDVKRLPPYELVVNHKKNYVKYDAARMEFVELNETDVRALMGKPDVIRLVEATSSELTGWRGVSVLFASPGVDGIDNFSKVDGLTFIMPTWTLEELEDYNSLLPVELKLAKDELLSRYDRFGGIPRFVFSQAMDRTEAKIKSAIASFSALDVISYCRKNDAVREKDYSHCVLEMVPTQADFRANFYLDFMSMHIAEAVIDKVHGDSLARVLEFAVVHEVDDSGSTAVVRGKVYELLCHKWFSMHMQRTLHFRSLCSATLDDVTIPKEMEMLDVLPANIKSFGALDAFIWDGQSKCYGLQMTLNADHGIKAAPLNKFLKWLKEAGDTYQFYFTFVAPSKIATSYRKQSTTTATGAVSKTPGASAKVDQFVAALDVDGGDK
ncbi:hypothetical protein F442_03873 [Phytophthora nicotianae P10297]|uniref:Crinkler effector protein N-terminal domain-containing protein n=1 Tax=Phytophthora nicotianae P10297 TaxID=1317064 RepID=W2ZUC8_PHYNI|nr:hypothetical protein F442_03873 [Phytophthora nicotianae P10297]